jgi:hypothetical protein
VPVSNPVCERRRSQRIAQVLPLSLHTGQRTLQVRTVDISESGVLVVSPEALSLKFGVVLANPSSGKRASGWVVRCATGDAPGAFEVAIRFIEPSPAFWGSAFGT